MTNRLDALAVREKDGKSYFTKIGAAFPNKNGGGWSVLLDAMPAPNEGQFKILLREPLPPREGQRAESRGDGGGAPHPQPPSPGGELDDDVPF